jgi:hypothetical protein
MDSYTNAINPVQAKHILKKIKEIIIIKTVKEILSYYNTTGSQQ